jgi:hypothetical protein
MNPSRQGFHGVRRHTLATAVVLALAGATAQAQLSTATLQGQVSSGSGADAGRLRDPRRRPEDPGHHRAGG